VNLGKIVGTVVASTKDPSLLGVKIKLIQPLNDKLESVGEIIATADPIGSRTGDVVMWVGSREASLAMENKFCPVDAAVVGLVDRLGDKSLEVEVAMSFDGDSQ
jgi:ethanolamine utilization protein EutN